MALTASQTRNLNPNEQAGGISSPGTLLTQGGPGFVGGGVTQSTPYAPGGGEATRSGMFTNIQDYLKANEGAAAPIVSKFEEKAQGVASPVGKMAEQTQTSLSGLKSNIETAKSGLESSLASQRELKGILEKARSTPSALSTAEIGKFRTGVGSYATPDATSSIQSFVPQKEKAASSVADLIASANKAQSELQPLGEISGVKGLIRQFNPNERVTAGGSSLDAFITRQAPEYEKFTQGLGAKLSGIESAKTSVNPLFSDIERYLGTGEGSLANIGSQFDPGYATGGKFQSVAEGLRKLPTPDYESQFGDTAFDAELEKNMKKYGGGSQGRAIDEAFNNLIASGKTTPGQFMTEQERANYSILGQLAGKTQQQIDAELNKSMVSPERLKELRAIQMKRLEDRNRQQQAPAQDNTQQAIALAAAQQQAAQQAATAAAQQQAAAALLFPTLSFPGIRL